MNRINLTSEQCSVVDHDEGAILVRAGPGSGKTRVLIERIKRLLEKEGQRTNILALTFSNRAGNEMIERLSDIPNLSERAFVGTIHSFCFSVLSDRGFEIGVSEPISILNSSNGRIKIFKKAIGKNCILSSYFDKIDPKKREKSIDDYFQKIELYRRNLKPFDIINEKIERELYSSYNAEILNNHVLGFDDLIFYTYFLFKEHEEIAEIYRNSYKFIMIDEAQDLSEAHYKLITILCGKSFRNIMMVGDSRQSIYGFAGSGPKYMKQFRNDFGAKELFLTHNFRSSDAVLKAAKCLFPKDDVIGELKDKGRIHIIKAQDREEEAKEVYTYLKSTIEESVKSILTELSWGRCAILARNNYILKDIKKILIDQNVPFYEKNNDIYQNESNTFSELELCLNLLANPNDSLSLEELLEKLAGTHYRNNLSRKFNNGEHLIRELIKLRQGTNSDLVLDSILNIIPLKNDFDMRPCINYLKTHAKNFNYNQEKENFLSDLKHWETNWDHYLQKNGSSRNGINSFLASFALGELNISNSGDLGLLTFHSSKGLEFDAVAVIGMEEGIIPDYRCKSEMEIEEERRIAYVAITRAKKILLLSYAETRKTIGGSYTYNKPSRFLDEIRTNNMVGEE